MPASGFLLQHWVPRHREGDCGLSSGPRAPSSQTRLPPPGSSRWTPVERKKTPFLETPSVRTPASPAVPLAPAFPGRPHPAEERRGPMNFHLPHSGCSPTGGLCQGQEDWPQLPECSLSRPHAGPLQTPRQSSQMLETDATQGCGGLAGPGPQAPWCSEDPGWGRRPATEPEGPRDGESRAWLKHYLEFPDGQQTINPRAGPWVCAQGHAREAGPGCDVSARPGRCGQERAPFTAGMCAGRQDRQQRWAQGNAPWLPGRRIRRGGSWSSWQERTCALSGSRSRVTAGAGAGRAFRSYLAVHMQTNHCRSSKRRFDAWRRFDEATEITFPVNFVIRPSLGRG